MEQLLSSPLQETGYSSFMPGVLYWNYHLKTNLLSRHTARGACTAKSIPLREGSEGLLNLCAYSDTCPLFSVLLPSGCLELSPIWVSITGIPYWPFFVPVLQFFCSSSSYFIFFFFIIFLWAPLPARHWVPTEVGAALLTLVTFGSNCFTPIRTFTMAINILSLNSKGLNHPVKRALLWNTAISHHSDILCTQETHFALNATPRCQHKSFPHVFNACYTKKQRGVMIAIRDSLAFQLHKCILDPEGRFIILVCTVEHVQYTIVNVYAPNTKQIRFLKGVMKETRKVQQRHLLVCGDFNLVPDYHMDSSSGPKRFTSPLSSFLNSHDLHDVWRCCHATERDYTFLSPRHNTYTRIDLFLSDKWLLQNVSASTIHTITWSDHAPVSIQIKNQHANPKSFVWRVNNSLLQHTDNQTFLAERLTEFFRTISDSVSDPGVLWCAHKSFMRGFFHSTGC